MAEKTTHPKSTCCIVGCARWSRLFAPGVDWMCGSHWKMVRKSRRLALRKIWRWLDANYTDRAMFPDTAEDWRARRLYKMRRWKAANMWRAVVREVMMKESGL